MSEPLRRAYVTELGPAGFGVGIFDYHGRLKCETFPADRGVWPEIADWLADRGAVEFEVPRSLAREFVVWLATQPFVLVEVSDPAYSVTIVTWRDAVTASASVRWFHAYDELTASLNIAGFTRIDEFLQRLPAAAKVTIVDVYGTSARLIDHLRGAGWTLDVRHVTDPWRVTIECFPDRHQVYARANGARQSIETRNDRDGCVELVSWIQGLGPLQGIIIGDADQDSTTLVELLRAARVRYRVERATRGELRGEPGEEFGGVRFELALRGLGWLAIRMMVGPDEVEVLAGYMTSAWHDTVKGIRATFDARAPIVIVWSEEPGAYQLVLRGLPNGLLDVQLRFLPDDLWGRPDDPFAGDRIGRWTVDTRDLAHAFASASYQLCRAVPDVDLKARWHYGAPIDELELLAIRASM
jgi:hypothetical protein